MKWRGGNDGGETIEGKKGVWFKIERKKGGSGGGETMKEIKERDLKLKSRLETVEVVEGSNGRWGLGVQILF